MDWKKGRFHPCPNFLNHFPEKLVDHFLVTTCVPNKVCDLSWPFHHQDWKIPRSNEHYQFRWSKHKWNYVNHQTSTSPETVASRGHTQLEIMILVAWSWIKVLNLPHHQTHHRLVWLRLCGLTCTAVWTSVWGVRGMVARDHWEGQGVLRPCAHLCDGWCKCHYWTVWSSLHLWKGWWDVQTHGVIHDFLCSLNLYAPIGDGARFCHWIHVQCNRPQLLQLRIALRKKIHMYCSRYQYQLPSLKLIVRTWKWIIGRRSFWPWPLFIGASAVSIGGLYWDTKGPQLPSWWVWLGFPKRFFTFCFDLVHVFEPRKQWETRNCWLKLVVWVCDLISC